MDPGLTLPDGYAARPATIDDVDAIAELVGACELHDDGEREIDLADVEAFFRQPSFDPSRDAVLVLAGGDLAAGADLSRGRITVDVHPAHRDRGLGTALAGWAEGRATGRGDVRVRQMVTDADLAAAALLSRRGYERTGSAWILRIDLDRDRDPVPPPDGVRVRAYGGANDDAEAYRVIEDAFSAFPDRQPHAFEDWRAELVEHAEFDPTRSAIAESAGRVVGAAMVLDYGREGWIEHLAVDAGHRGRGIGSALLSWVFARLHEDGVPACGLSTNSDTGALSLYERVGMRVRRSFTSWGKDL
jgi:mycothiol synthase